MLDYLRRLLVLIALFASGASHGENLRLNLSIPHGNSITAITFHSGAEERALVHAYANPCTATDTIIYTTASHPGGHRNIFNESTGGTGGRCYMNRAETFYVMWGGLLNSQYGNTFGMGPGMKFRVLDLWRVAIDAGIDVPLTYYERRPQARARKPLIGPLPMGHLGMSFKIGQAEVGMVQMWLPKNAARLRATVVRGSFSPLPSPESWFWHMPTNGVDTSLETRDTKPGTTLFLNWTF